MTAYRLAIVEDDELLRANYSDALTAQGFIVESFPDREGAMAVFQSRLPDLVIIDIGLGSEVDGGYAICQWLRQRSKTLPILFLSARDSDIDIVSGLRMGADDYLTKPISLVHLAARVTALFQRIEALSGDQDTINDVICLGELELDVARLTCHWAGDSVDLTLTEFWMVASLVRRPGHVKDRDQLMQEAQLFVDENTVTSHIKRIRKKFKSLDPGFDRIDTVYGMGYRWRDD